MKNPFRATALGSWATAFSLACGGEGVTDPPDPPSADRGIIETRVVAEGTDLDLDGWVVALSRGGVERGVRLLPSGGLTAQQTATPGDWEVTLTDAAGNCTPAEGTLSRSVTVSAGDTVRVAFNLRCEAIPPLVDRVVIAVADWSSNVANGLYALDPATGESRRLTAPPEGAWDNHPHISADGKRVVYVRHDQRADPSSSIRIVNADGTDEPGILSRGLNPRWSPDGSRIAFSMGVDGTGPDIHVIRPDSTGLTNLTRAPEAPDITPDWSPDGAWIVFRSIRRPGTLGDLYVMGASGTEPTRLTVPTSGGDFAPRWSPLGDRIAFSSTQTGNSRLYLLEPDGTNRIMVSAVDQNHDEFGLTWSPDGSRLVFKRGPRQGQVRTPENDPDLFILRLEDGEIVQLTDNEADDHAADWGR